MKKSILLIIFIFVILTQNYSFVPVFADNKSVEEELNDITNEQIGNLDLSDIESIVDNLQNNELNLFGTSSFWEKLTKILSGEVQISSENILKALGEAFFDDLLKLIPLMALIVSITILLSIVGQAQSGIKRNSVGNIIHFVCYGLIVFLILNVVIEAITMTSDTILLIQNQMQAIFPILLTMLTAVGGTVSATVYQPAFALLAGGMMSLFAKILLPIFIFTLAFCILSNLTSDIKFNKFTSFFSSTFKWILGIAFTLFFGFISIQGITAGTYDGISIRTAKYAVKNSVPLIGGYLSDGMNLIVASSVLIKNAVGASGLILLFATVIFPIIKIIVLILCLKLTAAILEPITDNKISNFISGISKTMSLLIAILCGIAFMYLLLIGLVMSTANFV